MRVSTHTSAAQPVALTALSLAQLGFAERANQFARALSLRSWTEALSVALAGLAGRFEVEATRVARVAEGYRLADQLAGPNSGDVLRMARSQIGNTEGPRDDNPYGRWFGYNHAPWCGAFVSWVFAKSGHPLPAMQTRRGFMGVAVGREWARSHGRLVRTPQPGDVFFIVRRNGKGHTGIVESVNGNGTVTTIEGNTDRSGRRLGHEVARRVRTVSSINGQFFRPSGPIDERDRVRSRPVFPRNPQRMVGRPARGVTRLRPRVRR